MFAARKIALAGHEVFVFNRDIKPGGLAEYGIYPVKHKMKFGLRKQFAQVLALPNLHYFGHVQVGDGYDLKLSDLAGMHPAAVLFTCGAQGTRKLGLPGEDAAGVYAAKDFVYHYNQLPPYASHDFSTGKNVGIVGMGNVAIDIARWLLDDGPDRVTESVVIIARRGPLEIKFDDKEIAFVERHIPRADLIAEIGRVSKRCAAAGQEVVPEKVIEQHFKHLRDADAAFVPPRLSFRFLSSPAAILPDSKGRIAKLEVAENDLVARPDGSTKAVQTSTRATLNLDTLIFAIGDEHDACIGLPMGPSGYATMPATGETDEPQYQVWNPATQAILPGWFVAGWARRASTGLVGIARHDGELGADRVIEFLKSQGRADTLGKDEIISSLCGKGLRPVTKSDLDLLGAVEQREAGERGVPAFKFSDNQSMYEAIRKEREAASAVEDERCQSVTGD